MTRYIVWFRDCIGQVAFDNYIDAHHYASLNACIVCDCNTGEIVEEYIDDCDYEVTRYEED